MYIQMRLIETMRKKVIEKKPTARTTTMMEMMVGIIFVQA